MKPGRKKRSVRQGRLTVGLWMVVLLALAGTFAAGAWAQGDYSLEYGIECLDSVVCQTTDYQVVDIVVRDGAEGAVTASTAYVIAPVVGGGAASGPVSRIELWMLY